MRNDGAAASNKKRRENLMVDSLRLTVDGKQLTVNCLPNQRSVYK